jgi:hypothetical protein
MRYFLALIFILICPVAVFAYKIDDYSPAHIVMTIGNESFKLYAIPFSNIEQTKEGMFFYDIKGKRIKSDQIVFFQGQYFMTKLAEK